MTNADKPKCQWCGGPWHKTICPLIKRIEFAADGRTWQAVEFHPQPDHATQDHKPFVARDGSLATGIRKAFEDGSLSVEGSGFPILCERNGQPRFCPTEVDCRAAGKCLNSHVVRMGSAP